MLLESFFEKGERPSDETAEDSRTANKKKECYCGDQEKKRVTEKIVIPMKVLRIIITISTMKSLFCPAFLVYLPVGPSPA